MLVELTIRLAPPYRTNTRSMSQANAARLSSWPLPRRSQNHQYSAALMAQVSAMLMTAPSTAEQVHQGDHGGEAQDRADDVCQGDGPHFFVTLQESPAEIVQHGKGDADQADS